MPEPILVREVIRSGFQGPEVHEEVQAVFIFLFVLFSGAPSLPFPSLAAAAAIQPHQTSQGILAVRTPQRETSYSRRTMFLDVRNCLFIFLLFCRRRRMQKSTKVSMQSQETQDRVLMPVKITLCVCYILYMLFALFTP